MIEFLFCFSSCSPKRLAVAPPAVLAASPDSPASSALSALELHAQLRRPAGFPPPRRAVCLPEVAQAAAGGRGQRTGALLLAILQHAQEPAAVRVLLQRAAVSALTAVQPHAHCLALTQTHRGDAAPRSPPRPSHLGGFGPGGQPDGDREALRSSRAAHFYQRGCGSSSRLSSRP